MRLAAVIARHGAAPVIQLLVQRSILWHSRLSGEGQQEQGHAPRTPPLSYVAGYRHGVAAAPAVLVGCARSWRHTSTGPQPCAALLVQELVQALDKLNRSRSVCRIIGPALLCQSHVGRRAPWREDWTQALVTNTHHQVSFQQPPEGPVPRQQLPHDDAEGIDVSSG